jgi:two-component system sensor histidine kinase DesK
MKLNLHYHKHWVHYLPMIYFGFFFLRPIVHHGGAKEWLLTLLGALIFVLLYLTVMCVGNKAIQLAALGGMVLMGALYAPRNEWATCFFIFAAAMSPFVVERDLSVLGVVAVIEAVALLEARIEHFPWWFLMNACAIPAVVALGNIHLANTGRMNRKLREANAEIERLAKTAERERIARDLHDVLGQTLSVIILKSELAGKLIERDLERAKAEIADVERTSRAALAEVRSTIRGYRVNSLEAELAQARTALEAGGVAVQTDSAKLPLSPAQESVVALVVREAVTNVLRHAQARNCRLRLAPGNGNCRLEIQDDGRGGPQIEGHGLRGMRERVEALGGTLRRDTSAGTKLTIEFPLSL